MVDNTTLNPGASGDNIRDIDRGTAKTQVVQIDVGGQNAESLVSKPLPQEQAGQLQRIADLMESLLIEMRITNVLIASLQQSRTDDADTLRGDLSFSILSQ
jgi:hypothetical protein